MFNVASSALVDSRCIFYFFLLIARISDIGCAQKSGTNFICLRDELDSVKCGANSGLLGDFIDKSIKAEYERLENEALQHEDTSVDNEAINESQKLLEGNYWELKPFARLTGVALSNTDMISDYLEDDLYKVPGWKDGSHTWSYNAYKSNGIKTRNGNIVVPISSVYLVYSFVHLEANFSESRGCPDTNHKKPIPIKHTICKFNILEGKDIQIISKTQVPKSAPYRDKRTCNFYHSYVSTNVHLDAGDEVSVKVSDLAFLKHPELNYFGVVLI